MHHAALYSQIVADIAPTHYDAHNHPSWSSVTRVVDALHALPVASIRDRAHADALLAAAGIDDRGLRQFVLQNLQPPAHVGHAWSLRCNIDALCRSMSSFATFPFDAQRTTFVRPAQFIAGGQSSYLQPQHYARIRALFPAAEFEVIANAGHWLHAEQPDAFFAKVAAFL